LIIAFCLLALLLAALVGITQYAAPLALALTGVSLLCGTVYLVRQSAGKRLGTTKTLCVLFFCFAVIHIVFGYTLADLTTEHTSIRSNPEALYATAMLINCIG
jgi:predicted MFS family arabinose efflux permease